MPKSRFGCSSVIAAVNLQFELAGHHLFTDIKFVELSEGKRWVCEFNHKHVPLRTVTRGTPLSPEYQSPRATVKEQWAQQAPKGLTWGSP